MNTPEIGDLNKLDIPMTEERTPDEAVRELIEWYDLQQLKNANTGEMN